MSQIYATLKKRGTNPTCVALICVGQSHFSIAVINSPELSLPLSLFTEPPHGPTLHTVTSKQLHVKHLTKRTEGQRN